jgi:NADH-quinone oxidoreductase subunit I
VRFEIDLLLCVFCGYCVEACPCDAIRMDTRQAVMSGDNRRDFVIDKTKLMDWDPKDYPLSDAQSQKAPGRGAAPAGARGLQIRILPLITRPHR